MLETRAAFRFRLPVARTEAYNSSIVPKCVRVLRDGEAALYNPFTKKMREAAKRRCDMAMRKSGKAQVFILKNNFKLNLNYGRNSRVTGT